MIYTSTDGSMENAHVDLLAVLNGVQYEIASTEGLKELWEQTKQGIAIMFGSHAAMVKFIRDNNERFDKLQKDKMIRTVMPKDLNTAINGLEQLNKILEECRKGKPINMRKYVTGDLANSGVELKEDGKLYADKFQCGNWGAGKGKTKLSKPMTFKKTVEEFGWQSVAPSMADMFIKYVEATTEQKMETSISNHYKDLMRVAGGSQEKTDLKTDHRVALNQIRNCLVVRNLFIKFIFKQLNAVLKAAEVETTVTTEETTASY